MGSFPRKVREINLIGLVEVCFVIVLVIQSFRNDEPECSESN